MKKMLIRVLAFCLALCSLALVSCGNQQGSDTDTKDETTAETLGALVDINGLSADGKNAAYRMVRNDISSNTDADTMGAVAIKKAMTAMLGVPAVVITDYTNKNENADLLEIVVGKTNRQSKEQYTLAEDEWIIIVEENKIYLNGQSNGAMTEAVERFIKDFMGYDSTNTEKQTIKKMNQGVTRGFWIDPEKVPDDGNPKVLYGLSQAQADEYFADILDGLFTGETIEVNDTKTVMGSKFGFHFPDIVYVNGEYWAYYICYRTDTGKGGVGLAISKDGVEYEDYGCVIQPDEPWDKNGAYFAGVWLDTDGKFYCVYECKGDANSEYGTLENVALAVSEDGVTWEKEGVIIYKTGESWQKANVGTPDLYKKGDEWFVFFHGFDYYSCQIGVSHGTDFKDLYMEPNPIIPTEPDTLWSGTTGRRDVIYVGGYYYMVFEISTEQPYGSANWGHKFARSKDLINWEVTDEPLLVNPKSGFGYDGTNWCIIGKHIYVFYRSGNKTCRAELKLK